MQKVPVETIGENDAKIGMQALFNDKRKMQEQAEKEGAEIIEIPLPDGQPGRHAPRGNTSGSRRRYGKSSC